MSLILALDQGTTSSRAMVFDQGGRVLGMAQSELPQIFPKAGWVEHDPEQIWGSQLGVAREALDRAGVTAADIAAIGITNQRETAIVWERRSGKPIYNAIVWQDRRTAGFCEELRRAGGEDVIREKTGLVIDPYFSGTKFRWILEHVPGARERASELAFGTVDAWLLWNLTGGGVHATDVSNASRTMLFNIRTGEWDEELLRLMDIPRAALPVVRPSSGIFGESRRDIFGTPVKIGGMAGDQQAALFGQNCFERGQAKNTYGTGCFMLMNLGLEPVASRNRLITTVAWKVDERTEYALEGSVFVGGAVAQWLRDGLGLIKNSNEIEALAATVPDCGGVYFVPALAGLGAPHWDPRARGAISGLTRGTRAGHIARAALEGIAFQVADVLEAMREDSGIEMKQLRVDGGASANNLLMQFQADILQAAVVRPVLIETTAMGAAFLAGLAAGCWRDREAVKAAWRAERVFEPSMRADEAGYRRKRWAEALKRARGWEPVEAEGGESA
ncbi:MAG: glycerol kinase GlpK [Limisphaerales bacterium]